MKTLNYVYLNKEYLEKFIYKNKLLNYDNILLQIFTGFVDIRYIKQILKNIKEFLPNIKIIGTTTSGEIINGTTTEKETILSFSLFQDTKIITFYLETFKDKDKNILDLINKFPVDKKAKAGIAFANGMTTNGELYIEALRKYDENLIIAGGLAGDNQEFKGTFVFNEEKIVKNGIVIALLYNDNLIVNNYYLLGWKTIGRLLEVTKVENNIIYEINNQKVIDVYSKYLGENIAKQLPDIGLEFPLVIHRNGIKIARTILTKNKNSFVFAGNIKEGDKVTFSYRDINFLNEKRNKLYQKLSRISCESIFIYSCIARKVAMKKDIESEIEPLNFISNTSGFFTYGEFFSNKGITTELLNQTMTILALSEDRTKLKNILIKSKINKTESNKFIALSSLLSETLKELKEEVHKNREKDRELFNQAQKTQMVEMLSMIAHQWRQPLNAISTNIINLNVKLELGKYDFDIESNRNHFLEFIKQKHDKVLGYTDYLSNVIDDFRNFFIEEKKKDNIKLNFIVENALKMIGISLVSNRINVIKKFNTYDKVSLYQNKMIQVIINILKNSEDGFIKRNIKNKQIIITTEKNNGCYIIRISDNAGGIDENIIKNVFDPYFSTKYEKNGSGLGLYISKIIIEEQHNGRLTVKNIKNGVEFEIFLKDVFNVI